MTQFLRGFGYLHKGLRLIQQPGLRRFALIPVLINIVVFVALGLFTYRYFSAWLHDFAPLSRWEDFAIVRWITSFIQFLFIALLLMLSAFTFTLVANFIGAPFNSLLAERVEAVLRGQPLAEQRQSFMSLLSSIPKTLFSELRKVLYLLVWLIPIGILYWIPGLQVFAPFVMLAFGAWVFALEYLDYPMGNHGMGFGAVKRRVKQERMLGLGFGSAVALLTAIPIVNLIVMPAAVAGATALYSAHYQEQI